MTVGVETSEQTFQCRTTHHESPDFPLVAPDAKANGNGGVTISKGKGGYRQEYLADKRKSQTAKDGDGNTWETGCKHFEAGYMYSDTSRFGYEVVAPPPPPSDSDPLGVICLVILHNN